MWGSYWGGFWGAYWGPTVTGDVEPPPQPQDSSSAGVRVVSLPVRLRGRLVAQPAELRARATVTIPAAVRITARAARLAASADVRLAGAARLEASASSLRGRSAAANPGHWVIVVEADPDEDLLVVASGGST